MSEGYVEINGVKTWHASMGSGPPVVLLHGGLGGSFEWEQLAPAFAADFTVHRYDRRAHGRSSDPGPFSYATMADDAIAFLEQVVGGTASLVGWSDGGNIGLAVASRRPDLVDKLVVFGANIRPDGVPDEVARGFASMQADAPDLADLRAAHAAFSPDGEAHWPVLLEKEKAMALGEVVLESPRLAAITAPTLVMIGDRDMVTIEHAAEIYRGIESAQLAVIPGAPHHWHMTKPELFVSLVKGFLLGEAAPAA